MKALKWLYFKRKGVALIKIIGEDNVKIDRVFDYELSTDLASNIQELLNESFQKDFPKNRIYFK